MRGVCLLLVLTAFAAADDKKEATLWDGLGGEPAVKKVVDDWFELLVKDPKVNVSRDGKFKSTPEGVAVRKKLAIAFISAGSGGPIKYEGRDMKTAHKGMAIQDSEFDAALDALKQALASNRVKPADAAALLKVFESTRKEIVEGKKPG